MKFLFDLFPVILFFAAFKFFGIFVATGVAIAATFAQIAWVWFRRRKIDGFNYKNKSNNRRRWGHRQALTRIEITSIG